jgi:hypothetical protein
MLGRRYRGIVDNFTVPNTKPIHAVVNKLSQMRFLLDKGKPDQLVKCSLTINWINGATVEHSHRKTLMRLAQDIGASKT